MERKELLSQINSNSEELAGLLSSLNQAEINTVPFEGSWTARQLVKHVIKSNSGFVKMLNGPAGNRLGKPDEFAEKIKAVTEYGYSSAQVVELSKAGLVQSLDKMAAIFTKE